eukprot:GFUD01107051.1.p1 GENE.GFUD01107051.1~~GFUD01107051.1.p1  ORF type:complete len:613 (+),score=104.15 GFUD01107051.1:63-1901(+)
MRNLLSQTLLLLLFFVPPFSSAPHNLPQPFLSYPHNYPLKHVFYVPHYYPIWTVKIPNCGQDLIMSEGKRKCVNPQKFQEEKFAIETQNWNDDCCKQIESLKNQTQYILTKQGASTCDYRELFDTSQDPRILRLEGNCNGTAWKRAFKCIDEDLKSDCSTPNFITWFDVISRCFHQDTEGKEILDSSFCQPKPSEKFVMNFTETVDALEGVVKNNPELEKLSQEMWETVAPEFKDFCPGNFSNLIRYLKIVMTKAPQFISSTVPSGLPQIQMLNCYIRTEAGKKFFSNQEVNQAMIKLVNSWAAFLDSEESLVVLNEGQFGWKGKCAQEKLKIEEYIYNKTDKYWGYKSWNEFFSRPVNLTFRPDKCKGVGRKNCMTSFGDFQKVRVKTNLSLTISVQAKNEDYSLLQLFNNNETLANYFVGGSLMQTLFMPFNYHRYHACVGGEIVFAQVIPGLLYTLHNTQVPSFQGTERDHLHNWVQTAIHGFIDSLTYISHHATRAVFIIKTADEEGNQRYVGEVAIGLQSISSTIINPDIKAGVVVEQGQELGRFQYGGSSGMMIVSDPYFQWRHGAGPSEDVYLLNDKIGEFNFCKPGKGKPCLEIGESTLELTIF